MLTEEAGLNGHLSISENFTYIRKSIPEKGKNFSYSRVKDQGTGVRVTIANLKLRRQELGARRKNHC